MRHYVGFLQIRSQIAMKHLLGSLKSQGKAIVAAALLIDKWAWPSIEIVEIQLATSAGAGIQLQV